MDFIRVYNKTSIGLTCAVARDPVSYLITFSFYWGYWMIAGGDYLDVMVDRLFEEYPEDAKELIDGRLGKASKFADILMTETSECVSYLKIHSAILRKVLKERGNV